MDASMVARYETHDGNSISGGSRGELWRRMVMVGGDGCGDSLHGRWRYF